MKSRDKVYSTYGMLVKCPECNREISDQADTCPNCGYPIKLKEKEVLQEVSDQDELLQEKEGNASEGTQQERSISSKKTKLIAGIAMGAVIVGGITFVATGNMRAYNKAQKLLDDKKYSKAIEIYAELDDYKDAQTNYEESSYQYCKQLMGEKNYKIAIDVSADILDYKDTKDLWTESVYEYANQLYKGEKYADSLEYYRKVSDFSDSKKLIKKAKHMVKVQNDKTKPIIYGINEGEVVTVDYNSEFNINDYLNGIVTMEDNVSSDIKSKVVSNSEILNEDGSLDTNKAGDYDFRFKAIDEAGNEAEVSFVVKIDDTIYVNLDNPNPVVYEGEYGKVTLQKTQYDYNAGYPFYKFDFLVENKSDSNLGIVLSDGYIGDYSVDVYGLGSGIASGKQGVEEGAVWLENTPEDKLDFTELEFVFSLRQENFGSELYSRRMVVSRDVFQ